MEQIAAYCWSVFDTPILETTWNRMDRDKSFYVWFNAVEAALWMALGLFVFARCVRRQRRLVEIVYSFSFIAFGITDVLETHRLTTGLLVTKLFVLISILLARQIVMQFYLNTKL